MPRNRGKTNEDMWKLARHMNRLMDEWMHAGFRSDPDEMWEPPVDVVECEHCVCITAEVAGMKAGDIQIAFAGNTVILTGTRTLVEADGQTQVHQMELARGKFRRTIAIPFEIDPRSVQRTYRAGLLRLVIPRRRRRR